MLDYLTGEVLERQDERVRGFLLETSVLERLSGALACTAGGDEPGAMDALAEALALACSQGYVRVSADEGPPMGGPARPAGRRPAGRTGPSPRRPA